MNLATELHNLIDDLVWIFLILTGVAKMTETEESTEKTDEGTEVVNPSPMTTTEIQHERGNKEN